MDAVMAFFYIPICGKSNYSILLLIFSFVNLLGLVSKHMMEFGEVVYIETSGFDLTTGIFC